MPIDWIDLNAKYHLTKDHPEVKTATAMYENGLKAVSSSAETIAKKAAAEKDAKKKKALEEEAKKVHQAGLIKLRKEVEVVLGKIVVHVATPALRVQEDVEAGEFDDLLDKMKMDKKTPAVQTAFNVYSKAVMAAAGVCNSALIKAAAEKDQKKRSAQEQAAMKTFNDAKLKLRNETRAVIGKIPSGVTSPPKRIQEDVEAGEFDHDLQELKIDKKSPQVQTAFNVYSKAVQAAAGVCNSALIKAAAEKDQKKRQTLEEAAMKTFNDSKMKLRTETRNVLAKIKK